MATEEQLLRANNAGISANDRCAGQYFSAAPSPAREVAKVGFWLSRVGSPTGNIEYRIRKYSDNSLIASKTLDASTIATSATYYELTLDTPVSIDYTFRMYVYSEIAYGAGNFIRVWFESATNPKANEQFTTTGTTDDSSWQDGLYTTYDCAYIYTYLPLAPQIFYF